MAKSPAVISSKEALWLMFHLMTHNQFTTERLKTKGILFILVSDLRAANKQQAPTKSLNAYSVAKNCLGSYTCKDHRANPEEKDFPQDPSHTAYINLKSVTHFSISD